LLIIKISFIDVLKHISMKLLNIFKYSFFRGTWFEISNDINQNRHENEHVAFAEFMFINFSQFSRIFHKFFHSVFPLNSYETTNRNELAFSRGMCTSIINSPVVAFYLVAVVLVNAPRIRVQSTCMFIVICLYIIISML